MIKRYDLDIVASYECEDGEHCEWEDVKKLQEENKQLKAENYKQQMREEKYSNQAQRAFDKADAIQDNWDDLSAWICSFSDWDECRIIVKVVARKMKELENKAVDELELKYDELKKINGAER